MIKVEDIRDLVTEYLPANPSYELSKAIVERINRTYETKPRSESSDGSQSFVVGTWKDAPSS